MRARLDRREMLKLGALGGTGLALPQPAGASPKPPNILFLFADDQRFSTIRALNNPEIQTPNLDKLAGAGTAFTNACIMGGTQGGVCVPSRAMLMTGRALFRVPRGMVPNPYSPELPDSAWTTFPETLRKAGYTTFGTGKWHNRPPSYARSFEDGANIFFGGMSNHLQVPVHDFDPTGRYSGKPRIGEKFSSELFSDGAVKFLNQHRGDKPFCLYVAYTAPHDPRMAPQAFRDRYSPGRIALPANFLPEHPWDNGNLRGRDESLAPWPRTPEIVREHMAAYYAMITHLDEQIGRVLEALEKTGQAGNTIIVFAGDNGLALGQHGLFGKQSVYDHSVHVPLLMAGPGIARGARRDGLCYLLDLFPTLCDLAGVAVPASVDGKSLAPVLRDPKARTRDSLFHAYVNFQRAVRTERWKLILYNVDGRRHTQLFDLGNDPLETRNLAGDARQGGRIRELTALLKDHMKTAGDPMNLDRPDWGTAALTSKGEQ